MNAKIFKYSIIVIIIIAILIVLCKIVSILRNFFCKKNEPCQKKLSTIYEIILFILGLVFSLLGLAMMIGYIKTDPKDSNYVVSGLSIVAFGISLFNMADSVKESRKNDEKFFQLKDHITKEIKNRKPLNPSNEDLHNEIEKLKEQNQEIIGLLKEKNQTNVHIYVNEEDKNKKTRKNGEYKK